MSGATNVEGGDFGTSPSHSATKLSSIKTGDMIHQVGRNSAGLFSSSNGSGEHAAITQHAELEGRTIDKPSEVDRLPPNCPRGTRLSPELSTREEATTSVPGRRLKSIELLANAASQSSRLPEQPRWRLPPGLEAVSIAEKRMARRCSRENFQRYNSDNRIGSPTARETSSEYIAVSSTHGQGRGLGDSELGGLIRPIPRRPLHHHLLRYLSHPPSFSANEPIISSNTTINGYENDDRSDAPSHSSEVHDRRVTPNSQETHAGAKAAGHLLGESPPYQIPKFTDEGSAQRQCERTQSFHPRRSYAFHGFQEEPAVFSRPEKYATAVSARGHRSPSASRSTGRFKSQYHRDGYKQQGRRSPLPLQAPFRLRPQGFRSRYAPEGSSYSMLSAPWDALQREMVATQGPRLMSFCSPGRKLCSIRPKTGDIASGGGSIDQRCQLPCSSHGASQRPTYLPPYSNAEGAHFSARFRQDAVVPALGWHRSPSPLRTTGRVKPDCYRSRFAQGRLASPEIRRFYPSQSRLEITAGGARAALPLGKIKKDARSGPIYSTLRRVASRAVGLKQGQPFEDHGLPRSGDDGIMIGNRLSKRKGTPSPPPPPLPPLPPLPSEPSTQNTAQERTSRDLCGDLEDEREMFPKRRKMGDDSFTEGPQDAATDRAVRKPSRKRKNSLVWSQFRKACDRCTEKKVRCNGSNPTGGFNACSHCKRAGESCAFGICRRSGPRDAHGHKTTEAGAIVKRGEFEKVTERYGACRVEGCRFANKDGSFRREHYHCRIGDCSYTGKNMSYLLIHRKDDHEELSGVETSSSTADALLTPGMTEGESSNEPRSKRMRAATKERGEGWQK